MSKNLKKEIADLEGAISSPATPEAQKITMRKVLEKLKTELTSTPSVSKSKAKNDTTPKGIEVDFDFIEKYTPDYYSNSNVTISDDLAKFIDGEMNDEDYKDNIVSEFGEIDVKDAKKLASEIDQELMLNAIEEYEEQTGKKYTKTKTLVSVDGKSKLSLLLPSKAKKPTETDEDGYDCNELIEKEKSRISKAKTNAEKRASKTPATQNKEAIERATDRVENDIEERLEKGEVTKSELEKLIDKTEALLKLLKSYLPKIK